MTTQSTQPAYVTITRPGNSLDDARIEIRLRLAMGKTVTATLTPEQFALALTGSTDVPAQLRLRNIELVVL